LAHYKRVLLQSVQAQARRQGLEVPAGAFRFVSYDFHGEPVLAVRCTSHPDLRLALFHRVWNAHRRGEY
jgi:hypothetical protein